MPKSFKYQVKLYPACLDGGFVTTTMNLCSNNENPKQEITAAGMDNLIAQITSFANEHGESCSAYVKCLATRKPPGFKDVTKNLYFNLKTKEEIEAEKQAAENTDANDEGQLIEA